MNIGLRCVYIVVIVAIMQIYSTLFTLHRPSNETSWALRLSRYVDKVRLY